jgi:ketosteroid isomerase-like protein
MAEEALEIVRGIYCRTLRLDPDLLVALAEVSGPDTEFDFTDAYPDGPVVRGVDGVRRIASNWPWEGLQFEPERFVELAPERVLVFVRAVATGVGSGVPVERRTAHECTFSDGQLVRFKVYSTVSRPARADRPSSFAATRLGGAQCWSRYISATVNARSSDWRRLSRGSQAVS